MYHLLSYFQYFTELFQVPILRQKIVENIISDYSSIVNNIIITLYFNNIKLHKPAYFKIKLINNFVFMTPVNEYLIIC